jgi:uncharacterized protein YqfB (UPF0267 family)
MDGLNFFLKKIKKKIKNWYPKLTLSKFWGCNCKIDEISEVVSGVFPKKKKAYKVMIF